MAKFVFIGPRGESSSACDSFDGCSPALSFFLSSFPLSFSVSLCSRKIMISPGTTTESRIALVSRHVRPVTGSEKIIALSSIYKYLTEYRAPSKCTIPSCTQVYFSTKSREDSLDPSARDVTFGPWGPMIGSYSPRPRKQHVSQCFLKHCRITRRKKGIKKKILLSSLM